MDKAVKTEVWWRCQTCGKPQREEPEQASLVPGWRIGRCQNLGCKSRKKSKRMGDMAQFRKEERVARTALTGAAGVGAESGDRSRQEPSQPG